MLLHHPSKGINAFDKYYLTFEESKESSKSEELVLSKNRQMRKALRVPFSQVQTIHFTHHLSPPMQVSSHVLYRIDLVLASNSKTNEQKKSVVSIAMSEY